MDIPCTAGSLPTEWRQKAAATVRRCTVGDLAQLAARRGESCTRLWIRACRGGCALAGQLVVRNEQGRTHCYTTNFTCPEKRALMRCSLLTTSLRARDTDGVCATIAQVYHLRYLPGQERLQVDGVPSSWFASCSKTRMLVRRRVRGASVDAVLASIGGRFLFSKVIAMHPMV